MFNVACGIIQNININELIHLGVCSPYCQQTLAGQKHAVGNTQTCQDPSSLLLHFSKCTVKPQLEVIATTQSSTVYCKSSLRPSRKSVMYYHGSCHGPEAGMCGFSMTAF